MFNLKDIIGIGKRTIKRLRGDDDKKESKGKKKKKRLKDPKVSGKAGSYLTNGRSKKNKLDAAGDY